MLTGAAHRDGWQVHRALRRIPVRHQGAAGELEASCSSPLYPSWLCVTRPASSVKLGCCTISLPSSSYVLQHACLACSRKLQIEWVDAGQLEKATESADPAAHTAAWAKLKGAHGVLVPGGTIPRKPVKQLVLLRWLHPCVQRSWAPSPLPACNCI